MSIYNHDFANFVDVVCYNNKDEEPLFVQLDTGCDCVELYKKDVIALAKHFKLTEEDLK